MRENGCINQQEAIRCELRGHLLTKRIAYDQRRTISRLQPLIKHFGIDFDNFCALF